MKKLLAVLVAITTTFSLFGQDDSKRFEILLGQCASINSGNYKCTNYLQTVRYLQAIGQTKAIERLKDAAKTNKYEDQVIILTKLLFKSKNNTLLRRPMIGNPGLMANTSLTDWQNEPIEIINNIPFLITNGYSFAGKPEPALTYLEYCIERGEWVSTFYEIKTEEGLKTGLNELLNSKKWRIPLTAEEKAFLEKQVVR